jgi:hypothetical protein
VLWHRDSKPYEGLPRSAQHCIERRGPRNGRYADLVRSNALFCGFVRLAGIESPQKSEDTQTSCVDAKEPFVDLW